MGFFVLLEILSRVGHYVATGSTYGLYYGLPAFINRHQTHFDGYFKYQPEKTLHQEDITPPSSPRSTGSP